MPLVVPLTALENELREFTTLMRAFNEIYDKELGTWAISPGPIENNEFNTAIARANKLYASYAEVQLIQVVLILQDAAQFISS